MDREKVIKGLENLKETIRTANQYTFTSGGVCAMNMKRIDNALDMLKDQEVMTPDEFKSGLMEMFSSIWESEIDHPIFQDTVGELMEAAIQLYKKAVKWE